MFNACNSRVEKWSGGRSRWYSGCSCHDNHHRCHRRRHHCSSVSHSTFRLSLLSCSCVRCTRSWLLLETVIPFPSVEEEEEFSHRPRSVAWTLIHWDKIQPSSWDDRLRYQYSQRLPGVSMPSVLATARTYCQHYITELAVFFALLERCRNHGQYCTNYTYPRWDSQAELIWVAWLNTKIVYPLTVTHLSTNPARCSVNFFDVSNDVTIKPKRPL